MITGEDTVFLAGGDSAGAIERFLDRMAGLWPGVLMAVAAYGQEGNFTEWATFNGRLPAGTREVLIARDRRMVNGWEEAGYVLDEHGEGPVCIILDRPGQTSLPVRLLADPLGREGFSYSPYDAVLITAGSCVVTAVTPPAGSGFTENVLSWLEASLSGERCNPSDRCHGR